MKTPALPKFKPCRKCASKSKYPGYLFDSEKKVYYECSCHKNWRKLNEAISIALKNNFSIDDFSLREYKGTKSRSNYEKLMNIYVPNFERFKNKIIYIYGPNGTQKTTVAKQVGIELIKNGYIVYYNLMQNLIRDLTILENQEREEKLKPYYQCDLLILDESFDRQKVTIYKSQYQIPFLDTFLRDRVDIHQKGILFVSNIPADKISKEEFGASLYDFINRKVTIDQSALEFLDNYISNINQENLKGMFEL